MTGGGVGACVGNFDVAGDAVSRARLRAPVAARDAAANASASTWRGAAPFAPEENWVAGWARSANTLARASRALCAAPSLRRRFEMIDRAPRGARRISPMTDA